MCVLKTCRGNSYNCLSTNLASLTLYNYTIGVNNNYGLGVVNWHRMVKGKPEGNPY